MKCTDAQKYLSAFADGELSTESNLRVLDHLKMCPPCAGKVSRIQELRVAVKRVIRYDLMPMSLLRRVMHALGIRTTPELFSGKTSARPRRTYGLLHPLALAATVVMAIGFWQWTLRADGPGRALAAPIQQVKLTTDTLQQHRDCSRMADMHHRRSLGRDRTEIRDWLTWELGFSVLVPDLTGWEYQFQSADTCGIQGRKAAHIIYRSTRDGRLLSLFTCDKIIGLNPDASSADCMTASFTTESVSAWSSADASHLLLGAESPVTLCEMTLALR